MPAPYTYTINYLGDDALLIDFGNSIHVRLNQYLSQLGNIIKEKLKKEVQEIVISYSSIALYFDAGWNNFTMTTDFFDSKNIQQALENIIRTFKPKSANSDTAIIKVPVCYEADFSPDMALLSSEKNLSPQQIIELHCQNIYQVYMIGFLPGFAYMGEVDEQIQLGRKSKPVQITAGSVGIAGKQTGIYPLNSPGGWNIIGRTPLLLFEPYNNPPCFLKAGDRVQFYPITTHEFKSY